MRKYTQLSIEERENIQYMRWEKKSVREIARVLCREPSTISRELTKNFTGTRQYYARLADCRAKERIKQRGERLRLKNELIREYVKAKLELGWSPEQIAGRLPRDHPGEKTNHESIYQYIYSDIPSWANASGDDLRKHLKRHHRIRRRKGVKHGKRQMIPNRIGIEARPEEVESREVLGHWEGDTMVSRQSRYALQTLVERVSGLVKIRKLQSLKPECFANTAAQQFGKIPKQFRKTMTLDNGIENTKYEKIGIDCFFADPYSSWQRGTNENTNGLIRWYLPKKTDFALISDSQVQHIEYMLNSRPRKRLNYLTPFEVFSQGVALKR